MSRKKISLKDEENTKIRSKLKPPYSPKAGGNRYVVYVDYKREEDPVARVLVWSFLEPYAAAWFINTIIHKDTWEECDAVGSRYGIMTSSGIRITMFDKDIWMLLDYEPTEEEAQWEDRQLYQSIMRLKYGRLEGSRPDTGQDDNGEVEGRDDEGGDDRPRASKDRAREKAPRVPKPERAPRPDTSGYVSANDIAKRLGVEGREVRGVLRALSIPKPDHGWSWPKEEAKSIEGQVGKALKEITKGKRK